jgi:integrase
MFFCNNYGYSPFPTIFTTIAHWAAHLMQKVKPDTAKSYINAIHSFHLENNFSTEAFNDPHLDLLIRGGKRVYGVKEKRLRLPLTASILLRILNEITNDEEGVNVKMVLCVAFAIFLRSGEFTWDTWGVQDHQFLLARTHVQFNSNYSVTLTLPSSKTDPYHKGAIIPIASSPSPSPLCPVTALHGLYSLYPHPSTYPLFSRPYGQPFTKRFFIAKVRELLLRAGIPSLGFSGHSIRKGAAVTAALNGVSRDDIKLLGRWKSDAVDNYLDSVYQSNHASYQLYLNTQLLQSNS